MRLNQYLAKNLGYSRRLADDLIGRGLVRVNGQKGEFHFRVKEGDLVEVSSDGKWVSVGKSEDSKTIVFYKPIFCVTTRKDEFDRKTIYSFLPKKYYSLKPAGRLDYMSEGLLVLSDDGDLIQKLTHPKFEHSKTYLIALKKPLETVEIKKMKEGLVIDDYKLNSVEVNKIKELKQFDYLKLQPHLVWYKFVLTEGRNNQIRKMCQHFGKKVVRLIRVEHGDFEVSRELFEKKFLEVDL